MSSVKFVDFKQFVIDMDDKNTVKLKFDKDGEESKIDIGKYVQISFIDENIDLKIKDSDKFNKTTLNTYSKSLLFLIDNVEVKRALKEYFAEDENANKEVFVVKLNNSSYIVGDKIDSLDIEMNMLNEANNQKKLTETEKKEDLKVYETPSNMFDVMISLVQQSSLKYGFSQDIILDFSSSIKKDLEKTFLELKESENKSELRKVKSLLDNIKGKTGIKNLTDVFDSLVNDSRRHYLETLNDEDYVELKNYMLKNYKSTIENYKELYATKFPFKKLQESGIDIPVLPIIDLQAGSGDGILNSATKNSFPMQLQGLEFRTLENLGLDNDTLDFRYKVETGKNFNIYKSAIEQSFRNGTLHSAISATPVYLNPPYTADNQIAKESVDILKNNQLVFGLFPTSMKNFLSEQINGFIFEVNKELTGYTDERVPQKLLFVVGRKFEEEILKQDVQKTGLLEERKHTFHRNLDAKDVESAIKEIQVELNLNARAFKFDNYIRNTYSYHEADEKRLDMVFKNIKSNMDTTDSFLQNSEKLFEAIEKKNEYIRSQFGSENMLLKSKVFPNIQYYSEDSKIEYLNFADVVSNHGLLVAYRDNYPEILDLVQSIAKKEGIDVSIAGNPTSLYDLSSPAKPEIKDKTLTENIGLMKNYYLPSSFNLTKKENKEHLLSIIEKVYHNNNKEMDYATKEALSKILNNTNRLITKLETNIKDNTDILKEEVFVAIDEDGIDIGKFQISKTDFYKAMQELKYFDLNDYIELAQIDNNKKSIIIENLMKHIENTIHQIAGFNEIEPKKMEETIFKSTLTNLKSQKLRDNGELSDIAYQDIYNETFVKFVKEFKLSEYFNQFVDFDKKLKYSFIDELTKNEGFLFLKKDKAKEVAEDIFIQYSKSPLDFFDFKREQTEEFILDSINEALESENLQKLTNEQSDLIRIDVYNQLSQDFVKQKAVFEASQRLAKLMIMNYGYMKFQKSVKPDTENSKLYDEIFKSISMNTFGLMEHQYKAAERFLAMSDDTKMFMQLWEMRAGKSLAFIYTSYLLSLYNKDDSYLFLEAKNTDDIFLQMMTHLPMIPMNANYYLAKSNAKKSVISPAKTYTHLVEAEYYPNIPESLKPFYVGRGEMATSELASYAYEFEKLILAVEEKGLDKAHILENYKDSKFLNVLNISCMKNM